MEDYFEGKMHEVRFGGVLYRMVVEEILSRIGMCVDSCWEKKCRGYTVLIRCLDGTKYGEYDIVYSYYTSEQQDKARKQEQRLGDL